MTVQTGDLFSLHAETKVKLNRLHANFLDGQIRQSATSRVRPVIEPSTGETVAEVVESTVEDVDASVVSARAAFEDGRWNRLPPFRKESVLRKFADLLREHRDVIIELDIVDNGMPRAVADHMFALQEEVLDYYAGWPSKLDGVVHPSDSGVHVYTRQLPIGVVAGIVPWNGPAVSALWKVAPALASGNSVILKPAEQTPMSALFLAELAAEAGVPEGVFNVVQGTGEVAGAALVTHPGVDKITFTGSTDTGRAIQRAAADSLKRVTLELGGKSPNIVFADANLTDAVAGAMATAWGNSGQACMSGSRLLVQREVHDAVVEMLVTYTRAGIKLGNGFDPNTTMGPLISAEHLDRVENYIRIGSEEKACLALGGNRWGEQGYFVEPTIFTHVSNEMRIAREEIFGPVLCVIPFDSEEEAFAIANDTSYGLGGGVWTGDVSRSLRAAECIRSGTVWVNTYGELQSNVSFGGVKSSGIGRELGRAGIDAMTESKTVYLRYGSR
ncbi:aldehyde dehydrogenase [Mycolicibacterium sp. CBMA 226]|uniref:aldehyde dehydrogenase family protein n=1 Tax=Mycolicibacterium sp. CBMA 226 TaxID=2606611 RepID=UPI0012DBCBCD|nr:aldehyde dehydrogenase family protein [Mycolicibacterium sp. CBMA 226]MUL74515.1 aldehyde dehydrogenase family protein [Mycolicibacterium sp. CBMA 226]